jgi:5-methylcytosine-specific restriction endonuclease McrA
MGRKVLVLNADYSALSICTVPKAFLLVFLDKAELVAASEKSRLHTISTTYPLPSVIRLHRYVHLPYKGVMLSRQNVFRRDGNQCVYCGSHEDLTLDHVLPKSRGGRTNWDNLVTACRRCNARKGHFTPEEAGISLPRKPYKPSFIMFLRDFSGTVEENWIPFLGIKDKN